MERTGKVPVEITKAGSKRLLSGTNTVVAFHVVLTNDRCFNEHQVIDFDGEELDTHNSYNTNDGIYVVPESGIYVFAWIFCSKLGEWAKTELTINGFARGWTMSDIPSGPHFYNPSGTVVVANVTAGDHVFIRRSAGGSGCTILGQQSPVRTTFSGWKLN